MHKTTIVELTEEQKEQLKQIRERQARSTRPDRDDVPQRDADPLARALSRELRQAQTDRGFLLSLLDSESQAAARNDTNKTAWQIVQRYYPDDDELATAIKEALDSVRTGPQIETLLSSEVAWKIARHIAGKNSDYFSMREGLAELESIINLHFVNAALSSAATAMRDKCVDKLHQVRDNHLVSNNEHYEKGFNAALKCAEVAMRSLTLDQVKPERQ